MIIYTKNITPRIQYIFDFVLNRILGYNISFTDNTTIVKKTDQPIINYSEDRMDNVFWIKPHTLLFEKNIASQELEIKQWEGVPVFFNTDNDAHLPFDLFAAAFYLITRYEEYLPHQKDIHGRYPCKESLAYKNSFHKEPVIDQWAYILAEKLQERYPELQPIHRQYKHISTIDVDSIYAFQCKGIKRIVGATGRSLLRFDFKDIIDRFMVLMKVKTDPFYAFPFIDEVHKRAGVKSVFFFQVGDYGEFDKNILITNNKFQQFLRTFSKTNEIGMHPSYASYDDFLQLKKEKENLEGVTGEKINKSRQHYLRLSFPDTYENLIRIGITEDYSMGYASAVGFRAGTCTPFNFYNIKKERVTTLKIIPFQVMDRTLNNYMGLNKEESIMEIQELIHKVKDVNGVFVSLWHNNSLSDYREWKGWRPVFESMF